MIRIGGKIGGVLIREYFQFVGPRVTQLIYNYGLASVFIRRLVTFLPILVCRIRRVRRQKVVPPPHIHFGFWGKKCKIFFSAAKHRSGKQIYCFDGQKEVHQNCKILWTHLPGTEFLCKGVSIFFSTHGQRSDKLG